MSRPRLLIGAALVLLMAYLILHQIGQWRVGLAAGEDFYGLLLLFGSTTAMLTFLAAFSASMMWDAIND